MTIFISTHFMNEAERCDRISLMHAGKVLASGTPQELVEKRGAASLEEAFIACLQEAAGQSNEAEAPPVVHDTTHAPRQGFSLRRLFSYSRREAGTATRSGTFDAGADGNGDPDADNGLRHQYGCGKPALCGA